MGQCTSNELIPTVKKSDCTGINVSNENNLNSNCSSMANDTCSDAYSASNFQIKKFRKSRRSSAASWVSSKLQRKHHNKDLSAVFNLLDHNAKGLLVNINVATEEELMTLPGITRQLAKNIVDYRNTIGGFRRVEDLALVSGIGASMLQCIKNDITIKKQARNKHIFNRNSFNNYRHCSSRTASCDSIPSCDSFKSHSSRISPCVNVNSCSIFELMMVRGVTQEMAANIVHHRTKRGNFTHVNELIKVRGISMQMLRVLRGRLTCNNEGIPSPLIDSQSVTSCGKISSFVSPVRVACHRRTQSAPLDNNELPFTIDSVETRSTPTHSHRFSSEFSADLFELLSLRSERPFCRKTFDGYHNGIRAVRIGSWNVQQLTLEKVNNPGVLEVICRTILETGFSVLAIQEVACEQVLSKICCELNAGSLRRIREWSGPRGEWAWSIAQEPSLRSQTGVEFLAYLYNVSHGLRLTQSCLLQVHNNNNSKHNNALVRRPFIGYFTLHELNIVMVNLQLLTKRRSCPKIAEEEGTELVPPEVVKENNASDSFAPLIVALKEKLENEKFVALLGNFLLSPQDRIFEVLRESSHCPVIPCETPTDISYDNPEGSGCFDNMWLSLHCQKLQTGSWGVIREGLSHMAIPRGWGWGGIVSDHCPIYCDIFSAQSLNSSST